VTKDGAKNVKLVEGEVHPGREILAFSVHLLSFYTTSIAEVTINV
jgi:hypothetical protein